MSYISMWKNTFNFKGVTGRRDFWLNLIDTVIIDIVIMIMLVCFGQLVFSSTMGTGVPTDWLVGIYIPARGISFISLSVRRLHDIGKSGWWMLLSLWVGIASSVSRISEASGIFGLISLGGFICYGILLVFFCLPSKIDGNPYRKTTPSQNKENKEKGLT